MKRISIAPMMGHTDRHFRFMANLLAKDVKLYTPMIHADTIVFSKNQLLESENINQKDVGIQIAGNNTEVMAKAASIISNYNYDEININIGCPSQRVQNCEVGAALMSKPSVVADCIRVMSKEVDIPLSIKTRIGIDDHDDYDFLFRFVEETANAGCNHFIIHARKALLQGISPKDNRRIPPIDYERVYRLKKDFTELSIEINGEINSIEEIETHFEFVDGVMIGRYAFKDSLFLQKIQEHFYPDKNLLSKYEIINAMLVYAKEQTDQGISIHLVTRHMNQLLKGLNGARQWRNILGSNQEKSMDSYDLIQEIKNFINKRKAQLI
ncbi:MAG: tRNA dihydrouridine(20/20a) synthase DusA [Gammaproteobacteria bacterium]|nr:tRNA dihydrouridine(20/20a) synthase DusA [Gammaproteobacteria bacterium]